MLFDTVPKTEEKDLFDREAERKLLLEGLKSPLTVITGLRRTGKSSLIRTTLHSHKCVSMYLDLRKLEEEEYISYKDLVSYVEKGVNDFIKYRTLINFLKNIKGISVKGVGIELSYRELRFTELLEILNKWSEENKQTTVVAIDEAQELIKLRGHKILPALAYAYDNLKHLRFVVSGSKAGLLFRFLRFDDAESPLYGRFFTKVELGPFSREVSREFLEKGFKENKKEFTEGYEVYDSIGGLPGWLTYFGKTALQKSKDAAIKDTLEYGKRVVEVEFNNFLVDKKEAKDRYIRIMKVCSGSKGATWSEIKLSLEMMEKKELNDFLINNLIKKLEEFSFIENINGVYNITDRMISEAFR